jgi:hypothetical protein
MSFWKKLFGSSSTMGEEQRKSIYREHNQITTGLIRQHAMMGMMSQDQAIAASVGAAASQIERRYNLTEEEFMAIYREGNAKHWS